MVAHKPDWDILEGGGAIIVSPPDLDSATPIKSHYRDFGQVQDRRMTVVSSPYFMGMMAERRACELDIFDGEGTLVVLAEQAYFVQTHALARLSQDPNEILAKIGTNTVCGATTRIPHSKGKGRGDTVREPKGILTLDRLYMLF